MIEGKRTFAGRASYWGLALLLGAGGVFGRGPQAGPSAGPIRVILLSGQNNHDWKTTTPRLQAILEGSGRFKVDVFEHPERLTARELEPYAVIVSNWNAFGLDPAASAWPEETRRAYLAFARRGRGHVVVHAGSASFSAWEDYSRLTLATWKLGQTAHGPRHEFPVRIDAPEHPVTAGLKPFRIFDELWNRPGLAAGAQVLASSFSAADQEGPGAFEPAVLAGRFGQGRTLTILLGHDAEAMDNPGFRALLERGVEWAATGKVTAADPPGPKSWRWEKEADSSLALAGPGGVLWRFNYSPSLDVPYFHPLNTLAGRTLTWDKPPDHLWHHGLWFSWKFINAVNYWELDAKTGRPAGKTTWSRVKIEARGDHSARLEMDLAYRPVGEDAVVLSEHRILDISPPGADGSFTIDWSGAFAAEKDALLDRTPLPGEPGGQSWGGYSGLSLRFAAGMSGRLAVTTDGPIGEYREDRYRGRHSAVDYSGVFGEGASGAAMLDHPLNPRAPTPWYVIRSAEMSFFTPAFLCFEPLKLPRGAKLALRYRVIVHPGRFDAARLKTESDRFSRVSPESR